MLFSLCFLSCAYFPIERFSMEMPCLPCDFLVQLWPRCPGFEQLPNVDPHKNTLLTLWKPRMHLVSHSIAFVYPMRSFRVIWTWYLKNLKKLWKYIPRLLVMQFFFLLIHVITGTNQRISGFLFIDCMWEQVSKHL